MIHGGATLTGLLVGGRQTDVPCALRRELVWRVDLVGIGRGVTVRGLWREERKRDRDRGKRGGKERQKSACLGRGRRRLRWAEFVS